MISQISKPVIGKLTGLSVSGSRTGTMDGATSPKSPLDFKIQSPIGLKGYDFGGVGLAIVAALDEINTNKAVYNRSSNKSISIPINSPKRSAEYYDQTELDNFEEEYTVVTCRGPNKKSYTRVYYNGVSEKECKRSSTSKGIFDIAPARFGDIQRHSTSDFLSSCHLCNKKLHGKDIYMYRGEKAFCSAECRYSQIVMDEHKEKCSSEVSRSADIASSPYANDQIFSTGILAI